MGALNLPVNLTRIQSAISPVLFRSTSTRTPSCSVPPNASIVRRETLPASVHALKIRVAGALAGGILAGCVILLPGCGSLFQFRYQHEEISQSELGKQFTPEELKQDLRFMVNTLEDVHPNLYAYSDHEVFQQAIERVEQSITKPMTRVQFYSLISPLVALLGDGHTNVLLPFEEFIQFRLHGGLAFPFAVTHEDPRGLVISRIYGTDTSFALGDRIVSINGSSADSLLTIFTLECSGERDAWRIRRAAGQFRLLLWIHKITAPYDIEVSSSRLGRTVTTRVEGVGQGSIFRLDSAQARRTPFARNYTYIEIPGKVGYIDFRAMSDLLAFRTFLEATFSEIKRDSILGLIVDLRNNGGGNSQLGDELLSYITDAPYQMAARKEWKMSSEYKSFLASAIPWWLRWFPFKWVNEDARRYLGAKDGSVVISMTKKVSPSPNPLRFRGKVCFLIGDGTFSSAMMLSNAVGDFKLATLICEETGGIPNSFGEVYTFDLPITKLQTSVSSARFVRANGDANDRRGVIPDIEVRSSLEDIQRKFDAPLEFAKHWVGNDQWKRK
jgi:C-terminal processing protease CtpA/Prc